MAFILDLRLIGWGTAGRKLLLIDRDLFLAPRTMRKILLNNVARKGRDVSKMNIRTQGQGKWPPLSDFTRAKTGRRKALITAVPRIRARLSDAAATHSSVVFMSPGEWTLTQHHDGFTEPPTNRVVKVPLKKPGIIGLQGKTEIFFHDNKPTKVPRRPVWPEGRQLKQMLLTEIAKWKQMVRARINRTR